MAFWTYLFIGPNLVRCAAVARLTFPGLARRQLGILEMLAARRLHIAFKRLVAGFANGHSALPDVRICVPIAIDITSGNTRFAARSGRRRVRCYV